MKKTIKLLGIAFLAGAMFMSCEGPEGPAGTNGIDGTDGTDGVDGEVTCLVCHGQEVKATITAAYNTSNHFRAAATADHGTWSSTCAPCHTTEGFQLWAAGGTGKISVDMPQAWGCDNCHGLHETFAGSDYATRIGDGDAVTFLFDNTKSHDFGASNLCATCHQPRRGWSYGTTTTGVTTGYIKITGHIGPHYGVPAASMLGLNAYEFTGVTYPTNSETKAHLTGAGCVGCHMEGTPADHSFKPSVDACTVCHTSATSFDYMSIQTYVEGQMDELFLRLKAAGLLELGADEEGVPYVADSDDDIAENYEAVSDVEFLLDYYGALYNYEMLHYDASMGVHNPEWIKAVVDASVDALPAVVK